MIRPIDKYNKTIRMNNILNLIGKIPIACLNHRITNLGLHNLSRISLTAADRTLLGKGYKFIPRPKNRKNNELWTAMDDFIRRIRIRSQFELESRHSTARSSYSDNLPFLKLPNPGYQPPLSKSPLIEQYIGSIQQNLETQLAQHTLAPNKDNLTRLERKALKRWRYRKDVVVKPADKNLGIAIVDSDWYEEQVRSHLDNRSSFLPIDIPRAQRILNSVSKQIANISIDLPAHLAKYISQFSSHTDPISHCSHFYLTIKVHKPAPCGRPIVAAHSYITTPLSFFLTKCIEPFVTSQKRYVKNSREICRLVDMLESSEYSQYYNRKDEEECLYFVAGDVESLYPNVDIPTAVDIFKENVDQITGALGIHQLEAEKIKRTFLMSINTVLKFNIVQFNQSFYLQKNGIAMGTPIAPYFASMYMHHLEDTIPTPSGKILLWKRYIDDTLIIFRGTLDDLNDFLYAHNQINPKIKVNWKVSKHQVEFLDLVIFFDKETNRIQYKTHQKIFNKYLYIPKNSFHTPNQLKSWINAELNRYANTCSLKIHFTQMCTIFSQRLKNRGYSSKWINKVFKNFKENKGYEEIRKEAKAKVTKNKSASPITPFIITYNPAFLGLNIKRALTSGDAYREITKSKTLFDIVGKPIIAWKRENNIGNFILRAKYGNNQPIETQNSINQEDEQSQQSPNAGNCRVAVRKRTATWATRTLSQTTSNAGNWRIAARERAATWATRTLSQTTLDRFYSIISPPPFSRNSRISKEDAISLSLLSSSTTTSDDDDHDDSPIPTLERYNVLPRKISRKDHKELLDRLHLDTIQRPRVGGVGPCFTTQPNA